MTDPAILIFTALFGLAFGWAIGEIIRFKNSYKILGYSSMAVLVAVLALCLVYPFNSTSQRAKNFAEPFTLDGNSWMSKEHKGDLELVRYINENISGQPVIIEAAKDPYQYWSRISANTGLQAVIGWANHENLWRRDEASRKEIQRRLAAVTAIYDNDEATVKNILSEFKVKYVVVGDLEKSTYKNGNFDKFENA